MREIEFNGKKVLVGLMEDALRDEAENPEKYHNRLKEYCEQYVRAEGVFDAAEFAAMALNVAYDESSIARLRHSPEARALAKVAESLASMASELDLRAGR